MTPWKSIARDWVPPAILRLSRAIRSRDADRIRFTGDFPSWDAAAAQCTGYGAPNILASVLEATLKVRAGEAAFERDSVLFNQDQSTGPVLAGLMRVAARDGGAMNVLDLGGALGSTYFQHRALLRGLPSVRWNVVEQAHYVEAGRTHIQDDHLTFHHTVEACLADTVPNVVLLSSVLQYLPDPYATLNVLLDGPAHTMILDRTPYLNSGDRDRIAIQHVPESIYAASYPCRFFAEGHVLDLMNAQGFALLETFRSLDALDATATWKGHIFERSATPTSGASG